MRGERVEGEGSGGRGDVGREGREREEGWKAENWAGCCSVGAGRSREDAGEGRAEVGGDGEGERGLGLVRVHEASPRGRLPLEKSHKP